MSRVLNNHWVDERIKAQRVAARRANLAPVGEISLDILGSRAEVRRRGGIIPSWVIFGMILVAIAAVCITVNMRTHAKLSLATDQYVRVLTDVEALRSSNKALSFEVEQLRNDPRTIEMAARSRLSMVRSNEIVVPIE